MKIKILKSEENIKIEEIKNKQGNEITNEDIMAILYIILKKLGG